TAMELLASGCGSEEGIGELIAIDLGGATTDVYSIAEGSPNDVKTVIKGIEEPFAKRTVEGDIGMRYSIHGIVEACGMKRLSALSGLEEERIKTMINWLDAHKETLPEDKDYRALDRALASLAVETAAMRHAGTIEEVYTPMGETFLQCGKDLREVSHLILTGGALINGEAPEEIGAYALYDEKKSFSLRPKKAKIYVDKNYILAAMGLLSKKYPEAAFEIMNREINR
ncbi:MAG: glutamate mutase L, partial [Eubacterium sp.]